MPMEYMNTVAALAKEHNMKLHLDGSRIWNVSQQSRIALFCVRVEVWQLDLNFGALAVNGVMGIVFVDPCPSLVADSCLAGRCAGGGAPGCGCEGADVQGGQYHRVRVQGAGRTRGVAAHRQPRLRGEGEWFSYHNIRRCLELIIGSGRKYTPRTRVRKCELRCC